MDTWSTRASLLGRLKEGDDLAWYEFQRRYGDLIRNVASRRGLQPADCDDVMQDVLAALNGAMPGFTYDPSRGRFRGYLKTIVVNAINDRFRQTRGKATVPLDEAATAPPTGPQMDGIWEEEWRAYHVGRAMRTIEVEFSEKDRLAFAQHRQGRSAAETAEALGLSADQVYQARSRILRRVRELVAEQVEDEG